MEVSARVDIIRHFICTWNKLSLVSSIWLLDTQRIFWNLVPVFLNIILTGDIKMIERSLWVGNISCESFKAKYTFLSCHKLSYFGNYKRPVIDYFSHRLHIKMCGYELGSVSATLYMYEYRQTTYINEKHTIPFQTPTVTWSISVSTL